MIINDILDFSKIEAGQTGTRARAVRHRETGGGMPRPGLLPVAQKGIELVCDIDPALPAEWIGDAARLRQVLINLVGNATKFTHSGEIVVRVGSRAPGRRPLPRTFRVRDTGIGIPTDQHARIFDVFCQADGSTTP